MSAPSVQVWFSNTLARPGDEAPPFPGPRYTHVADLRATAQDPLQACRETFALTQHLEHDWTLGAAVQFLHQPHARSSSVGDVFVTGLQAWLVCETGFRELQPPPHPQGKNGSGKKPASR